MDSVGGRQTCAMANIILNYLETLQLSASAAFNQNRDTRQGNLVKGEDTEPFSSPLWS
jgi:hypothetical protein